MDAGLFRLLGDEARLRLLRVLAIERLNVTELTAILGIAQSGVSRHLGLLKEAGLVQEEREGGYTFFRLAPALAGRTGELAPLAALLQAQFAEAAATATGRADLARLEEIRRLRKENFDAHAGPDTNGSQWFICIDDCTQLPPSYNLFGRVTEGLDVAQSTQVGDVMKSVTVRERPRPES